MKNRRPTGRKSQINALWHALDEAAFGSERTLNLRELLPTAVEARARTEAWLRGRQVTRTEEVLLITGRGNQSVGGVGVIRQEVLGMLPSLRRRGIVESWREHSPGSIVVKLAPLSALIGAGRRRRDEPNVKPKPVTEAVAGLRPETRESLRQLALNNLNMLGIIATDDFIDQEMGRTFSTLMKSVGESGDRETALCAAILRAIDEGGIT